MSFWSLDTLATYFHFTMSARHVFPTDLMLHSMNLKYAASPIKLGVASKVDPLCFLFSDINQPVVELIYFCSVFHSQGTCLDLQLGKHPATVK